MPHLSGRSDQGEGHQAQKQEQELEIMEGLAMQTLNGPRLLGCFPTERQHGVLHCGLLVAKISCRDAAFANCVVNAQETPERLVADSERLV